MSPLPPPIDQLLRTTYGQRRVLLTGHTGFKGPWFIDWLHHLRAEIAGYALAPPTTPNHYDLGRYEQKLTREDRSDIRDLASLRHVIKDFQPEIIFHMAAKSVVFDCHQDPAEAFDVNAMGTARLLDAIRLERLPCAVVVVTTDKCYENREQVWGYRECDPLGEYEPYGASKAAAELVVRSYRHAYFPATQVDKHGVALATARAGNVIGGGDWTPHALVPELVAALKENAPLELRHPGAIRPWQHVLQAISGYLLLGARLFQRAEPMYCDAWNFGPWPGNEWPVAQFVEHFSRTWGETSAGRTPQTCWKNTAQTPSVHESNTLRLSIDKAVTQLAWHPTWDTNQSIAATVDWYRTLADAPQQLSQIVRTQVVAFEKDFSAAGQPLATSSTSADQPELS